MGIKNLVLFLALVFQTVFVYGDCCKGPDRGIPGPQGVQGIVGEQGPIGLTGPAATAVFISLSLQSSLTVNPQEPLLFDLVNAEQGDISYNAGTGQITLTNAGTYFINYGVTGSPSNRQVAVRLNGGIVVPGSQIDTLSSLMQGVSFGFVAVSSMSTLELINNQPNNSGQTINFTTSTPSSQSAGMSGIA